MSDPLRVIAQGLGTLENDGDLITKIDTIVREQDIALVVVGMPYSSDGGKGAKALEVERFIEQMRHRIGAVIETWDESYTSVNAKHVFLEGGMRRKQRRQKQLVDEMAARLMLQEYLDSHDH